MRDNTTRIVQVLESIGGKLDTIKQLTEKQSHADVLSLADLLTIIFVCPTFLAGWFGMNLSNLPFVNKKDAWLWMMSICVLWVLLVLILLLNKPSSFNAVGIGDITKTHRWLSSARARQRVQVIIVSAILFVAVLLLLTRAFR